MPYIEPHRREQLDGDTHIPVLGTPGELNWALTQVVLRYLQLHGLSYSTINDVLGALSGAAQEFYRRVAAPYEDEKRAQNGDVY